MLLESAAIDISEQAAQQQTAPQFQLAVNNAPVLIWVADTNAQCTYFNKTWLDFTGRSLEQELGNGWAEGVHPDDLQHCMEIFLTAFHAREPFSMEYRLRHATGEYRWILDNGSPQFAEGQQFVGYIGSCVDINNLKQTQTQAFETLADVTRWRNCYETAGRASNQVLYEYDIKVGLTAWRGDATKILGYAVTELGNQGVEFWLSLIHPDDRPQFQAALELALIQKQPFQTLEYRLQRKDGSQIWVQDSNEILLDDEGNPSRVIGFIANITQRKQAEAEQQQLLKRLSDLKFALDQAAIIATTDAQGRIIHVNDRFCEISQYSREELLGNTHQLINSGYHPKSFFQDLWQTISSGQVWKGEIKNCAKDGSEYWVDTAIVPFVNDCDQPFQYMSIHFEVTERKQTEEALRQSEEQNQAILSAIPDIMAVINAEGIYQRLSLNHFVGELLPGEDTNYVGRHVKEMLPPASATANLHAIQETLKTGRMQMYEQQLQFGERIQYEEVRMVPYQRNQVLCMVRNISDRKRAEEALRASEARFRSIFNSAFQFIGLFTPSGRFLAANETALQFAGLSQADVVGQLLWETPWFEGLPDSQLHLQEKVAIAARGEFCQFEFRVRGKDGVVLDLAGSLKPLFDDAGNMYQLLGEGRDISARKRAELSLQRTNQLLTAISQAQTQFITDANTGTLFDNLLETLLQLTDSEYGFIGEIIYNRDGQAYVDESYMKMRGKPYLKTKAITDIAWSEETRHLYDTNVAQGMEFHNLKTLFGQVLLTGQPVIANHPQTDPRRGGLPSGHPPLNAFLGIPFFRGDQLMGMVGIANRPAGYTEAVITELQPFLTTCASTIEAYRNDTRRKQAELALQQLNEELEQRVQQRTQDLRAERLRLQLALDAAQMGTWSCDLQTDTLIWSDRAEEIFGFVPGTLPRHRAAFLAQLHPEDAERVMQAIAHTFETKTPYNIEYRICRFDGEVRWVAVWGIIPSGLAPTEQQLIGVISDITNRKQSEIQLHEAQQFSQSIADKTPAALYIYDLVNNCNRYSNRSITDLLGYSPTAVQAMEQNLLSALFHPEDLEKIAQHQQALTTAADGEDLELEYRVRHANGEWRWFYSRDSVFKRDAAGKVTQYIGAAQDITERKQLEQELRQINAELERRVEERTVNLQQAMQAAEAANRAKSTFLANMSHELRTPLNAILGFAQLMSRDFTLEPEKRSQLSIINRSGKHLLNLINDILEMSKIEAGRTIFSPNCFDLYTLLTTLEEMFQIRAMEKGLHLTVDYARSVPQHIETDENKLRQVLINLLGNAIKFTRKGKVTLRVAIESIGEHAGKHIENEQLLISPLTLSFAVEDTGIGIAPEEIESLFEPFIQSKNRQMSQEGTGLGLSISRQFIQLMGGELTVDSTPAVGSSFRFSIPVKLAEVVSVPPPSLLRPIIGLAPNQPTNRILVVEDSETNRHLLVQLLLSIGFDVEVAQNGQEAIALWETWQPQLIWMDMRMPLLDGYEATQQIRNRELQAPPPTPTVIIALTANAFEEDKDRALAIGCDDFVRKPFQEAELLQKMAHYLGVEYLYAEADPSEMNAEATLQPFDVIAALQSLPASWLTQLHQATIQLDNTQMLVLIEQIKPEQPTLAALLIHKLDNFDLQQILDLLQEVRSIKPDF
ncbi:MAG: PAS domain S-box protein [Cyanobacteria bacterium RM1_2_2]|nr:PAS domain S-box protein [Cyanobacteria bacterium RM1_2_2]